MPDDETLRSIHRAHVADSLRQESLGNLEARADRWLQIERAKVQPFTHFSLPSSECSLLYRDGYFYACISLCQAVAESLVRYLCESNHLRVAKSFETNLSRLRKHRVLREESIVALERVWSGRNDFLHVNPGVSRDPAALQELALSKLRDLAIAERDAFAADYSDGKLTVEKPRHWP